MLSKFPARSRALAIRSKKSLFEPSSASPIAGAVGWIGDTLLGGVAVTLCVLAVAFVGLMMLTGRVPVRTGFRVVLECFVLPALKQRSGSADKDARR